MGVNIPRNQGVNIPRKEGGQFAAESGGQYQRIFHSDHHIRDGVPLQGLSELFDPNIQVG